MGGREVVRERDWLRAARFFWFAAAFVPILVVAAFQQHAPRTTENDDPFLHTITGFVQPTYGALTLEACGSFAPAQQLDLESRDSIAADELLVGNAAAIAEAPVHRRRANDPQLTLSLDPAGRSVAIDLQN